MGARAELYLELAAALGLDVVDVDPVDEDDSDFDELVEVGVELELSDFELDALDSPLFLGVDE